MSKKLIIRLSSFGDVVMTSSVFSIGAPSNPPGQTWDWVIAKDYADLISGHPSLSKAWVFDRAKGLAGWINLCRELWNQGYDEVFDLHRTLRTRIMKVLFLLWSVTDSSRRQPKWSTISKQRLRLYGYFVFKRAWPKAWRPNHWVQRCIHVVGGTGLEKPDLRHLVRTEAAQLALPTSYLCVMPSSKWHGKEWPVSRYAALIRSLGAFPVVLGTKGDAASAQLVAVLKDQGIPHYSGIAQWSIPETASVLANSKGLITGDTGMAHLAQSLGVKTTVIFGPTVSDMGFGPWGVQARAVESSLQCRPCSKDGAHCYRLGQAYRCLSDVSVDDVAAAHTDGGVQ